MVEHSAGLRLGGGGQGRSCTCVPGTVRVWIGAWLLGINHLSPVPPEHICLSLTGLSNTGETGTGSHSSSAEGSGVC